MGDFIYNHHGKLSVSTEGELLCFKVKGSEVNTSKTTEAAKITIEKGSKLKKAKQYLDSVLLQMEVNGSVKLLLGEIVTAPTRSLSVPSQFQIQKIEIISRFNLVGVCCEGDEGNKVMLLNSKTGEDLCNR